MDERVNPTTPMMYPAGVTVESDMKGKKKNSQMPNDGSIVVMTQQASYIGP